MNVGFIKIVILGFQMGNHLLSNAGYMILGVLFLVVTFLKEKVVLGRKLKQVGVEPTKSLRISELRKQVWENRHLMHTGTCACFSLFYTMGLTLYMIGVMSGCYHRCPTDVNFQFDTTYMYLLVILMAINLFKSRHPDLSPHATTVFVLLAINISLAVS